MKRISKQTGQIYTVCLCAVILLVLLYPVTGITMEEGQPLDGINWIDDISSNGESILIDEYRYQITSATRYYTQDGKGTGPERFVKDVLVEFAANEQGQLLSLREEFDFEGEFARKRNGQAPAPVPHAVPSQHEQKKAEKRNPYLEDGVWKN